METSYLFIAVTGIGIIFVLFACIFFSDVYKYWLSSSMEIAPTLRYKPSALARYILRKCPQMSKSSDISAIWTFGHLQTIISHVTLISNPEYRRLYVQMKDRGIIALDFYRISKLDKNAPVLLIIPTILGSANSVVGLCQSASARGFRPIVFNRRGQGHSRLTTPDFQVIGSHYDLRQVVGYLSSKYSGAALAAVSVGLGSSLLMSYLGEYGSSSRISVACCISPVFDCRAVYRAMTQPYKWLILQGLKAITFKHSNYLDDESLQKTFYCNDLLDYDRMVSGNAEHYGLDEYWEVMNPLKDVDEISCPMLFISAADDPICDATKVPLDLFSNMPNFFLCLTEYGGHCGFRTGFINTASSANVNKSYGAAQLLIERIMKQNSRMTDELSIDFSVAVLRFLRYEHRMKKLYSNRR